jgi:hypothetical protein
LNQHRHPSRIAVPISRALFGAPRCDGELISTFIVNIGSDGHDWDLDRYRA